MRESLEIGGVQCYGLEAATTLRHYLDCDSIDHIESLMTRFPCHVVEFTTFRKRLGTQYEHTIIWEVRNY